MPIVSANVHLDVKQTGYIAAHVGWKEPALAVIVAISRPESDGNSGTYRPESQNPAGGRDIGLVQINDKAWSKADPFTRFHPITNLVDALIIWNKSGGGPWGYPTKRNDTTLGVAAIRAELGANPYSIDRSPYWLLKNNGVDTMDLPAPPATLYVSRLPAPPMGIGGYPDGRANQLQRFLAEDGRYPPTAFDNWYGNKTAGNPPNTGGVKSVQRDLATCGLWTGPIDGIYSVAFHKVWDGALRFDFLTRWG